MKLHFALHAGMYVITEPEAAAVSHYFMPLCCIFFFFLPGATPAISCILNVQMALNNAHFYNDRTQMERAHGKILTRELSLQHGGWISVP